MILTTGPIKKTANNLTENDHYLAALGLKNEPFSTSPDPYYFFPTRQHQTCLNHLEIGIRLRRGANLIMGEIGTGKTTLCRTLLQRLQEDTSIEIYLLLNPLQETETDFLKTLMNLFHLEASKPNAFEMACALKDFLFLKGVEENKTLLLIIDEAQKLSLEALECLRTLLNYETNHYKLLQLILFSQLQLKEKLREMPNLVDRLNYKKELVRLNLLETTQLLHFRLLKSGYPEKGQALFPPSSIRMIHRLTGGYPRKICMLAHKVIQSLLVRGTRTANQALIEEIYRDEESFL